MVVAKTRRLNWRTWFWLSLEFLVLLYLNVPGTRGETTWDAGNVRHGWPWTFAVREVGVSAISASFEFLDDEWELHDPHPLAIATNVVEFSGWALLGDVWLAAFLLAATAIWLERRARKVPSAPRARLQFSLRWLMAMLFVCAVTLAAVADYYRVQECSRTLRVGSSLVPHGVRPVARVLSLSRSSEYTIDDLDKVFWHRWNRTWWGLFAPTPPQTDDELACLRYMMRMYPQQTALWVNDDLTDAQLQRLAGASDVRSLIVNERNFPLERFDNVRNLFMSYHLRPPADLPPDDLLARMRHMTRMRRLYVYNEHIDDDELAHVRNMPDLVDLDLTWSTTIRLISLPTPEGRSVWPDFRPSRIAERRISDRGLSHLEGLLKLERLRLEGTQVTGSGLQSLHALPRLRHLSLSGAALTDSGLLHINGCRRLQTLDISDTPVATLATLDFGRLPDLRRLDVSGTDISQQRLRELRRLHTQVRIVHSFFDDLETRRDSLWPRRRVTMEMLQLASREPKVRNLTLNDTSIEDHDLQHISGMSQLTSLSLMRTRIGDKGLEQLRNLSQLRSLNLHETSVTEPLVNMVGLSKLDLSGTPTTDLGLLNLGNFTNLEQLDFSDTSITDKSLAHLAALGGLKRIWLSDTQVTDTGLAQLSQLTQLRELRLDGTQITVQGLAQLSALSDLSTLWLDSTMVDDGLAAQLKQWPRRPRLVVHLCHTDENKAQAAADRLGTALPEISFFAN